MAAPITNSNETIDSITTGLLIHEVGFFLPPPLRVVSLFPISLFSLNYFKPPECHSSYFIVIFKAIEHCFI